MPRGASALPYTQNGAGNSLSSTRLAKAGRAIQSRVPGPNTVCNPRLARVIGAPPAPGRQIPARHHTCKKTEPVLSNLSRCRNDAIPRPSPARAIVLACAFVALCLPSEGRGGGLNDRFSGATGGIVRTPENLQPKNAGNLFGEAWAKLAYELDGRYGATTSLFALGNFVTDSKGLAYNNTAKFGIGLSHSVQVSDALNVTLSARYDWFMERGTDVRRSGIRLAVNYYYYKRWEADTEDTMLGLPRTANVFKSFGTIAYPGSLQDDDDNIVLTLGGELSADLDLPRTEWVLSPFAEFDFAWDKDRNGYNNKIVPGAGLKVRYPLVHGEAFAGLRLGADYRPIAGSVDAGPTAFVGWYKGF